MAGLWFWQDPIPAVDHDLVGEQDFAALKASILDAGFVVLLDGLRVPHANYRPVQQGMFTYAVGRLTNDFFDLARVRRLTICGSSLPTLAGSQASRRLDGRHYKWANEQTPCAVSRSMCRCKSRADRVLRELWINKEVIMSKPVIPSIDEIKGKWKQQIGAAKIAWGKLTEDELLRADGRNDKLAGLVQERYAITRDEADRQVKSFFEKNKS